MHISEGILPAKWAVAWFGAAAPFLAKGLNDFKRRVQEVPTFKPVLGLMGASIFIISMLPIPVPIAGTCAHPCGTPMAAILVGPFLSTLLAAVSLLLQALFFAHGGLTTLGANIISEGVVGSLVGYGVFRLLRSRGVSLGLAAGLAGWLGDLAVYATTSAELALALHGTRPALSVGMAIFGAFLPAQLPLSILEGVITAGMVNYVWKHRPDILIQLGVSQGKTGGVMA